MTEFQCVILNTVLYVLLFVFCLVRYKLLNLSTIISAFYAVSSLASLLLYLNPFYIGSISGRYGEVELGGVIYLFVAYLLIILSFRKFSLKGVDHLNNYNDKLLRNANVQKMDLLLLLYDKDSYKLTASGAVLEAIWDSKPIIALENYYFRYLFNKFGDLGILCDSLEDLTKYINSIQASNVIDTYNQTLQRAKEQLMPRNVVKQLEQIVR